MSEEQEKDTEKDLIADVAVANFAVITAIIDALVSSGTVNGNFLADRIKRYSDMMVNEESPATMKFMYYYEGYARNMALPDEKQHD